MMLYELWLANALSGNGKKCLMLKEVIGSAQDVYQCKDFGKVPGLAAGEQKALMNKELSAFEKVLEVCAKKAITICVAGEEGYPQRLAEIYDPPAVLYIKGNLPDIDNELCIASVGTRHATACGVKTAEGLCRELALAGAVIVSGMARGIDTASHKGALKADGRTIAVLGTPIDEPYPRENRELYKFISAGGAVVSEYAPGDKTLPANFPRRNRIISGLSVGTIIIEAPEKSGALITATHALQQDRDIFTVPCNIDNKAGIGSNLLLKAGAKPVLCALDVVEEYLLTFPQQLAGCKKSKADKGAKPAEKLDSHMVDMKLTEEQKKVKEAVTDQPVSIDEIVKLTGLSAAAAASCATVLELYGYIIAKPGGRYAIR